MCIVNCRPNVETAIPTETYPFLFTLCCCYIIGVFLNIMTHTYFLRGDAVAQLVEALRYKPEGRGLDSRWCH